ncbi:MAG: phosphoenolpyruvate--protein phosphotransferase [Verrucomicrobiales bacterium]
MAQSAEEIRFEGVEVSPGVVRGNVHIIGAIFEEPASRGLGEDEMPGELGRFEQALKATRSQILAMQQEISKAVESNDASIFDAHLLVLEDRTVLDEVVRELRESRQNIEAVFYRVMKRYTDSLRRIDDPYLRERVIDVEDVARRVIRNLEGSEDHLAELAESGEQHILVAHDLTPGDTATVDRNMVVGFATEVGSATSHTAIMARSLNIPAVVGLHGICGSLHSGDRILLDGYNGLVIVNPSPETDAGYDALIKSKGELEDRLLGEVETKSATADGREITLSGNIEFVHEAALLRKSGAEGVGLFRTEFFYLNKDHLPTEDEQAQGYASVAAAVQPYTAIFRTLDVGGDKISAPYGGDPEPNPFLGWRGIRVSLSERGMFSSQLKAILRASDKGKVGVMYPLVSGVEEVRKANQTLEECKAELREDGVAFDEDIEVGVMIEVPSAALVADAIAREVDFFSIGTNDLVQYTLAVDRVNERVADLYQPTHPAVIRLMRMVVDAARQGGIWAGICGEMAGDVVLTPLLVGLGFDELSVASGHLPRVKHAIRQLESSTCEALAQEVLAIDEPEEIYRRSLAIAKEHYPELLS